MTADRDIWLTDDVKQAVEADNPRRRYLLARKGQFISRMTVERYGLRPLDSPQPKKKETKIINGGNVRGVATEGSTPAAVLI